MKLKILTPLGTKVDVDQVEQVQIPAFEGEMGILPGSIPILTSIVSGVLSYKLEGRDHFLTVHHGFAEVYRDEIIVCVRMAEARDEIDKERSLASLDNSQQALQSYFKDLEVNEQHQAKLQAKILRARARLEL